MQDETLDVWWVVWPFVLSLTPSIAMYKLCLLMHLIDIRQAPQYLTDCISTVFLNRQQMQAEVD